MHALGILARRQRRSGRTGTALGPHRHRQCSYYGEEKGDSQVNHMHQQVNEATISPNRVNWSRLTGRRAFALRAAILDAPAPITNRPLRLMETAQPEVPANCVLVRVRACGVCRTDLHIVEGELPVLRRPLIPGHQIVGEIAGGATDELPSGTRVGVSWIGGTDGECPYCRRGMENLCDSPTFTGYTVDGGYAEYAVARRDFVFPLPVKLEDHQAAPLLCAGIIGFRSLRVAGVEPGERVGLYGFGASAHLAIAVLHAWNCEVYVATRGASHRRLAESLGARWVGEEKERPPVPLDRAITFAPSGDVVV